MSTSEQPGPSGSSDPARPPEPNVPEPKPARVVSEAPLPVRRTPTIGSRFGGPAFAFGIVAIAMIRAATAPTPPEAARASVATRRAAFADMANDEGSERTEAAHAFPGDLWSQDDDFHGKEQKRARTVASKRGMPLGDVLSAVDEGVRQKWPPLPRVSLKPGVVPCRPRLSY